MDLGEIAWLAGLLEGEGCFAFYKSPWILLQMCDGDVVRRAALIMDAPWAGPIDMNRWRSIGTTPRKPLYRCRITGDQAAWWMHQVYWFMGERRQAKIREALEGWWKMPGEGGHNYHGPKLTRNRPLGSGKGRRCPKIPRASPRGSSALTGAF